MNVVVLSKVKSDRLLLEEQLANFQSLLTASQTAAQYGRRMVALGLASDILKQNAELEKSAGELKKKLTAAVVPAPTYKVGWMSVCSLSTPGSSPVSCGVPSFCSAC